MLGFTEWKSGKKNEGGRMDGRRQRDGGGKRVQRREREPREPDGE